jgi:hypothetical protein
VEFLSRQGGHVAGSLTGKITVPRPLKPSRKNDLLLLAGQMNFARVPKSPFAHNSCEIR